MPAIDRTSWRSKPRKENWYVKISQPDTIASATVNQSSFTYPTNTLTVDGVSGESDVLSGMTGVVKDSSGNFKEYIRVRSLTSTEIKFGVISEGDISFADDDQITILNDFKPWTIIPRYTSEDSVTIYKDWDVSYTDEGTNIPPVCNAGGFRVCLDGNLDFNLTDSFIVNEDASTLTYTAESWPTGVTLNTGTVASGEFNLSFDAGEYWLHFTATDDQGGTHTKHVYVYCPGTSHQLVTMEEIQSSLDYGFNAKITLHDDGLENLHQSLVTIYSIDDNDINGPVKMVGWVDSFEVETTPDYNDLHLEIVSANQIADKKLGLSLSIEQNSSPTKWDQIKNLEPSKHIIYILHFHSTLIDICDLEEPSWKNTYYVPDYIDSNFGSLYSQANFIASAVKARFTVDKQCVFYMRKDPHYLSEDDKDGVATVVTLEARDINENGLQFGEISLPTTYFVRGFGVIASTSSIGAVESLAPGKSPGQGISEKELTNLIVLNQSELNRITGVEYEKLNRKFQEATVTTINGGSIFDPAYLEWIKITLSSDYNKIGKSFSEDRFTIEEIQTKYDKENGISQTTLTLMPEVVPNADGVTVVVPTASGNIPDVPYTPTEPVLPIFEPSIPTKSSSGEVSTNGNTSVAENFVSVLITNNLLGSTYPVWKDITPSEINKVSHVKFNPYETGLMVTGYDGQSDYEIDEVNDYLFLEGPPLIGCVPWSGTPENVVTWDGTNNIWSSDTGDKDIIRLEFTLPNPVRVTKVESLVKCTNTPNHNWAYAFYYKGWGYYGGTQQFFADYGITKHKNKHVTLYSGSEIWIDKLRILVSEYYSSHFQEFYGWRLTVPNDEDRTAYSFTPKFCYTSNPFAEDVSWEVVETGGSLYDIIVPGPSADEIYLYDENTNNLIYSNNQGQTFSDEISIGTAPEEFGNMVSKLGTNTRFSASNNQLVQATTPEGSFSNFGNVAPTSEDIACILWPVLKLDSETSNDDDLVIISNNLDSDSSMWLVTESGTTFTDITPEKDGVYGTAASPYCLSIPQNRNDVLVALLNFSNDIFLGRYKDGSWSFSTELDAYGGIVMFRKNDPSGKEVFATNGKNLAYFANILNSMDFRNIPVSTDSTYDLGTFDIYE